MKTKPEYSVRKPRKEEKSSLEEYFESQGKTKEQISEIMTSYLINVIEGYIRCPDYADKTIFYLYTIKSGTLHPYKVLICDNEGRIEQAEKDLISRRGT